MYYHYPVPNIYRNKVEDAENKNIIKVYGEGMVTATPDQATATIGVITENKNLTDAQKQNSETISKILGILNSFKIPPNNIQTFDYQVTSEYDYENGKQIFRGYRVSNLMKVTMNDLNKLENIINKVIEAGANYVSNVQFKVSNPNFFYLQALQRALRNAGEKAETIANDLKVKWNTTPFLIKELRKEPGPILPQSTFVKAASTEQFQPGILEITATVLANYLYY